MRVILSEAKDLSLDATSRKLLSVISASIVRFLASLGMTMNASGARQCGPALPM
jgi:hypothetical protein